MPSKYGGIPVESGSKYGGVPVEETAPATPEKGSYAAGLVNQVGQGLTLGTSDEIAATLAALAASIQQGSLPLPTSELGKAQFAQNYQEMRGPMVQGMEQFSQENPGASVAANIAGGLATGGIGLAKAGAALAPKGAGVMRSLAADTGIAATEGAIAGAGYADDGSRLDAAGIGAGLGAVTGGAAGGAMRLFRNKSALKQKAQESIESGKTDSTTAKYIMDGRGKLKSDKNAIAAIANGFDEGVVAAAKGASRTDKGKMIRMLNVLEKGRADRRYSALNRPSDVIGDSVVSRFSRVRKVNRAAGKKLDEVASTLKGRDVDYAPAVDGLIDDLDRIGVKFDDTNATVSFADSDIEGADGAVKLLSKLVNRARDIKEPDAYKIHRLKRYIDEQVSYGKTAEGLTGRAEVIVKKFRHNLDQALDSKFPNYRMVNDTYAETRGAIDALQDVAGEKMDLTGANADKAVGTLSRRLLSKAQSRIPLYDSLEELQRVATKYGGEYDDDLITQVIFVDELEELFGSSARTSFQGEIEKGVKNAARAGTREGIVDMAARGAQKAATAIRGKTEEELALESIRRLLKQGM